MEEVKSTKPTGMKLNKRFKEKVQVDDVDQTPRFGKRGEGEESKL